MPLSKPGSKNKDKSQHVPLRNRAKKWPEIVENDMEPADCKGDAEGKNGTEAVTSL